MEINGEFKKTKVWVFWMKLGAKFGCHQMPSRSFFIKGYQFPLCARCTGVLFGELVAIITFFIVKINSLDCLFLLVPMAMDWHFQEYRKIESNNFRRLITGLLSGFGLTYLYFTFLLFIISLFA